MLEIHQNWVDLMRLVKNTQNGECMIKWQDGILMSPVKFYLKTKRGGKIIKKEIILTRKTYVVS